MLVSCVAAAAELETLRTLYDLVDEIVCDRIDHDRTRRRGASLTGRTERTLGGRFDGELHIAIFEHDDGILAAHFALDRNSAFRRAFVDGKTGRGRAGERDRSNRGMIDDRVADLVAVAEDEVQNAARHAGLDKYLAQSNGCRGRRFVQA